MNSTASSRPPATSFAATAARLAANGYRPLPIAPGKKYPGFDEWQRFAYAAGCESKFAGYGCGVLTGDVIGLDIDVDCPDAAAAVEAAVREALNLGDAAELPRRIGNAPRELLVLRTDKPFRKVTSASYTLRTTGTPARVEVLGEGQQFVAYALHPTTGRPYAWNGGGDLLDVPRADLVAIDESKAHELVRAAEAALEEWGDRVADAAPGDKAQGPTDDDLRRTVHTGAAGVHDALVRFAARLVSRGVCAEDVAAALGGLLDGCEWRERDSKRWSERRARVADIARSAFRKYADPRQEHGNKSAHAGVVFESAGDLLRCEMDPIRYRCEPWIPEGMVLLAGRPKLGKTTLARQMLAAVASGVEFFDAPCVRSPSLFLSLEEGKRLARHKIEMANFPPDALDNMFMFYEWPRAEAGIVELHRALDAKPDTRFVVIDSLTKWRTVPDARTPAFVADYEAVSGLHDMTKARPGLTIVAIHHTRKAKGDDPIDDISGTYGLTAACDAYAVMRHHEDGAVLHVGGRLWDRDQSQFQLRRAAQRWELVGAFSGLSNVQQVTLDVLSSAKHMTPTQGAQFWNISRQSAHDRLDALVRHGKAYSKQGVYYPLS